MFVFSAYDVGSSDPTPAKRELSKSLMEHKCQHNSDSFLPSSSCYLHSFSVCVSPYFVSVSPCSFLFLSSSTFFCVCDSVARAIFTPPHFYIGRYASRWLRRCILNAGDGSIFTSSLVVLHGWNDTWLACDVESFLVCAYSLRVINHGDRDAGAIPTAGVSAGMKACWTRR